MIYNIEGKTYEKRLQRLKLGALEERSNKQDLIKFSKDV